MSVFTCPRCGNPAEVSRKCRKKYAPVDAWDELAWHMMFDCETKQSSVNLPLSCWCGARFNHIVTRKKGESRSLAAHLRRIGDPAALLDHCALSLLQQL